MGAEEDKGLPEQKARYVWDAKKLTWVESTETLTEEAQVAPAREVSAESVAVEAESDAEALDESVAAAAEVEAEELEYKGVLIRFAAAIIDFIALTIVGVILRYSVGHFVTIPSYALLGYGLVYFVGFWSWRGQTPGKMITRARVIRTDGRPVGAERAVLRYIFYLMPLYGPIVFFANNLTPWFTYILPLVGLAAMALNRQKRGIHDFIAGTCVINSRAPAPQPEEFENDAPEQGDGSGSGTSEQG